MSDLNTLRDPKLKITTVRFSARELFLIRQASNKLGISVSDFIRQSCNTSIDSLRQYHIDFFNH